MQRCLFLSSNNGVEGDQGVRAMPGGNVRQAAMKSRLSDGLSSAPAGISRRGTDVEAGRLDDNQKKGRSHREADVSGLVAGGLILAAGPNQQR